MEDIQVPDECSLTFLCIVAGIGATMSGGDVTIVGLAKDLLRRGCKVIVLTTQEASRMFRRNGLEAEYWILKGDGGDPHFPIAAMGHQLLRMIRAIVYLRKRRMQHPVIVLPSSDMLTDTLPALFLEGDEIRRIALFHMVIPSPFKGYLGAFSSRPKLHFDLRCALNWVQQRVSLHLLKQWFDIVIPNSPYGRAFLERKHFGQKIADQDFVPLGEALENVTRLNKIALNPEDARKDFDACWVGRYHPQKGCRDLLEAWRIVCLARPESTLAIVGNVQEALQPLVDDLEIRDSVRFLGYVDKEEKLRTIRSSRLFLYPSYYEGRPASIAEAMLCGVPVVAYELPVYRGCYGQAVITVPVGDWEALASSILNLLDHAALYRNAVSTTWRAASALKPDGSIYALLNASKRAFGVR